jgi:hypothetical protein
MRGARWSAKPRAALCTATSGLYGLVKFPRFEGMGPAETRAFGQGDERMERKTNTNGTEMDEPANPKAMNDTVQETAKVPPRKGGADPPLPRFRGALHASPAGDGGRDAHARGDDRRDGCHDGLPVGPVRARGTRQPRLARPDHPSLREGEISQGLQRGRVVDGETETRGDRESEARARDREDHAEPERGGVPTSRRWISTPHPHVG